ncbi:hypothetical protein ACQ3G7_07845 [Kosakonia oryzendophytica]|uniref:hypothetical protein n=1 Tax=Kosakonia oryzendophytica TaxID=1005665 RepID=UPI003D3505AD
MLSNVIGIKLNVHFAEVVIGIESNDEQFLDEMKCIFFNHISSYQGNADIHISANFGVQLSHFMDLNKRLTSARCGLLVDTVNDTFDLKIYSLFKSKKLYKAAFREIRDYIDGFIVNQEVMTLHAACVSNDRGAVCIMGDKFAGKTTLMLKLLSLKYNFLSNDKPYVYLFGSDFYAFSLPVSAGVRLGSINIFPNLQEEIQIRSSSGDVEFSSNGRVHLTPKALCDIFNVNYQHHSKVRKFIYLSTGYADTPVLANPKVNIQDSILTCKNTFLQDAFSKIEIKICSTYDEALYESTI